MSHDDQWRKLRAESLDLVADLRKALHAANEQVARLTAERGEANQHIVDCQEWLARNGYEAGADGDIRVGMARIVDDRDEQKARAEKVEALQALEAENERLRGLLDGYPTMLEECAARINGMIEAYRDESEGLSEYFDQHGAKHSDENCPQDDTCECPESRKLSKAWDRWGNEVELAYRRLDRIREAQAKLAGRKPGEGGG